jgi:alpha-tubulin suppressor-like RCC1 family protein
MTISAGGDHTCAVIELGAVDCWGANTRGQTGSFGSGIALIPVAVSGFDLLVANQALTPTLGATHACARTAAGTLRCWGGGVYGQIGDGANLTATRPVTIDFGGAQNIRAVSAGGGHTCAIDGAGSMRCWGRNHAGQLGTGTNTDANNPQQTSGAAVFDAVSAGGEHTCAVSVTGAALCWGGNAAGQLGNGANTASNTPVAVNGLSDVHAISAGGAHTCALMGNRQVRCWGDNTHGQLGDSTYVASNLPVSVTGLADVIAISAGGQHTCAVTSARAIFCWGRNNAGQLGNGTQTGSPMPVAVTGINTAAKVSAGRQHTCALIGSGSINCWGSNAFGQLGNGGVTDSNTPGAVTALGGNVESISAGGDTACTTSASGIVRCWGNGEHGQLGDGQAFHSTGTGVFGFAHQVIDFPPQITRSRLAWPFSAGVRTSSGLAPTVTSNTPDNCRVTLVDTIHVVAPGVCSLTASQPGSGQYVPALPVTRTFEIDATLFRIYQPFVARPQ